MNEQIEPFKLFVPTSAITDLRDRLKRARLPDQSPGPPWAYGTDVDWMRGSIEYWRDTFDWRISTLMNNGAAAIEHVDAVGEIADHPHGVLAKLSPDKRQTVANLDRTHCETFAV